MLTVRCCAATWLCVAKLFTIAMAIALAGHFSSVYVT